MDKKNTSIENALLQSALLCGVTLDNPCLHRLQLFFCANFVVGKDSSEEDFQRYIETEFNKQDNTSYWSWVGRGLCELTVVGYKKAKNLFPTIGSKFSPTNTLSEVSYKLEGHYNNHSMILMRQGRRFEATIDGYLYKNIQDACRFLEFDTVDRSAPRILYNIAVKNNFMAT